MSKIAALPSRAVIAISGEDRVAFLNGIVSNDVAAAAPGGAVWAAFLTPQGKYLADFFVFSDGERLLLDVEVAQTDMLVSKLTRYRLRARAALSPLPEWAVFAAWGGAPAPPVTEAMVAPDSRLPEAGFRILSPTGLDPDWVSRDKGAGAPATFADWDRHRIALGLPDGTRDLEAEKTVLLEAGFDELHGISWTKGCYMGQELTARTRYRGLVKRRLVPVEIAGPPPKPGEAILSDGAEVGTMRSSAGDIGLAVIRLDALTRELDCGGARLAARVPAWLRMPEKAPQPA